MNSLAQRRMKEQAELIYQLGVLLAPLEDIVKDPGNFDKGDKNRILARFRYDRDDFARNFLKFTREPGAQHEPAEVQMSRATNMFVNDLLRRERPLEDILPTYRDAALTAIMSVPLPDLSASLAASTPFSTYCFLKDILARRHRRLTWVDAYVDASLFYRYLRDVPSGAQVVVVTWRKSSGFNSFLHISELYAGERGSEEYRLILNEAVHDRHLWLDDEVYHIGGSTKDAATKHYLTVEQAKDPEKTTAEIKQLIADGEEVFGPNNPQHPSQ